MHSLLEIFTSFVTQTIQRTGYAGIGLLMMLESLNIPIPSEIIMPFSGFLVFGEKFNFLWVVAWGTFGNFIGSLFSYYLGFFGGRPFFSRYGKFLLMKQSDLDFSDRFFQKYGSFAILLGRMLPLVRTFISFPAGISRMNIFKFSLYTLLGSFLWSSILTYAGVVAGENWKILENYFRKFDWLMLFVGVMVVAWWVKRHLSNHKNSANNRETTL